MKIDKNQLKSKIVNEDQEKSRKIKGNQGKSREINDLCAMSCDKTIILPGSFPPLGFSR